MEYRVGDLVVVVSSTISIASSECNYSLCKVVAVGKYDLICEKASKLFRKFFKVSKKRCVKVDTSCDYREHKTSLPEIGDLVTSMCVVYDNEVKTVTGVVEKICYDPADQQDCIYYVRTGQQVERCYLKNMIILERK